ncbi:hypothetical protein ROHU_006531 [Labeo rohita]|uniref:Uncharacterized protein n=1 Tax=Labeo rohita TaxID=84645 RepID=A0A498MUM7_LABRO|nr:hypothetical protein ROHU_006531 [Labeo rohita]
MSISESTTYSKTVDHQSKTNLPTSMTKETTPSTVMSISESTTYCKTVDHQSKTNLPTSMTKETTPSTVMSISESTTYSKTGHQSKTNLSTSMTKETTFSITTSTPPGNSTISEKMLVFTGVAVIVTGLICLCWFASKKRRKQNKTRSKKPDVNSQGIGMIYSLITSVPATSQAISAGFEHPKSQQDSTADPTDTRSAITSINPIYQPSDVLVDKQQKQENEKENELTSEMTNILYLALENAFPMM